MVLTLEALLDPFSYEFQYFILTSLFAIFETPINSNRSGMHRILVEVKSPDGITRRIRNISQTDVLRYLYEYQNLLPAEIIASVSIFR